MTISRDPTYLLERLGATTAEYAVRASKARSLVVSWEHLTFPRSDLRPLFLERHGWAPGRRVKGAQAPCVLGLDARGRTVVEETHTEFGRADSFFDWSTVPGEAVFYTRDRLAQGLLLFDRNGDEMTESVYATANGLTYEHYSSSSADAVRVERAEPPNWQWRHWHDVRASRAADQSLQRVTLVWPAVQGAPYEEVMWELRNGKVWRRRT